jgi:chromosome segregation ATPase
MNRFILLLVLVSGFLSGYLIGDYRGKNARETLQKVVETEKTLDTERKSAIAKLQSDLSGLNDKHNKELEAIRKDNIVKVAEWRRTKEALDEKIKHSTDKLNESDARLKSLVAQRDGAAGKDEASLNLEIAHLRKEREDLRREIEGNTCLQARVPHSVFNALNETNTDRRK